MFSSENNARYIGNPRTGHYPLQSMCTPLLIESVMMYVFVVMPFTEKTSH